VKKFAVVFEDTTLASDRWAQSLGSTTSSTRVTVGDILGLKSQNQDPNNVNLSKPIHPILSGAPEALGSAIVNMYNIRQKVKSAMGSNLANDPNKKEILKNMLHIVNSEIRQMKAIAKEFEKL